MLNATVLPTVDAALVLVTFPRDVPPADLQTFLSRARKRLTESGLPPEVPVVALRDDLSLTVLTDAQLAQMGLARLDALPPAKKPLEALAEVPNAAPAMPNDRPRKRCGPMQAR